MNPAEILRRLEEIEIDLAERQNEFADAARRRTGLDRQVEAMIAREYAMASGNTTDRRMTATAVVGDSQEYLDLLAAESTYNAHKAAVNVLQTRATIGQTLLRTMRESM